MVTLSFEWSHSPFIFTKVMWVLVSALCSRSTRVLQPFWLEPLARVKTRRTASSWVLPLAAYPGLDGVELVEGVVPRRRGRAGGPVASWRRLRRSPVGEHVVAHHGVSLQADEVAELERSPS